MSTRTFFGIQGKEWRDIGYIFSRNVFLLTNGIIAVVAGCLVLFGDMRAGIFLSCILIINMTLGLGQDIRAWYTLRTLQLLTAPRVTRMLPNGQEESVLTGAIRKGDTLRIRTGDEIPCDGTVIEAHALELSLGLITGEATPCPKKKGDSVLAGSIVIAGSGIFSPDTVFAESRIARMTEGIQKYRVSESPIQQSVNRVIRYSGYVLILVIGIVLLRGALLHASNIIVIKNIGALASSIVPQGLAFAMTLLFAYGAVHLYHRSVLLQEVNATEKLGRIRNLCMDKTGTLTENRPTVERMEIPSGMTIDEAKRLAGQYISATKDTSQTILAVKQYVGDGAGGGTFVDMTAFSSWHPYGSVEMLSEQGKREILFLGGVEHFIPSLASEGEQVWYESVAREALREGKRVICLMRAHAEHLPKNIHEATFSFVAVFILSSQLRPGIPQTISFFQNRGVRIRIISGDHPETVRTVATLAGVKSCNQLITGKEMREWTDQDFLSHAHEYSLFARVEPEQKEKIIEALRQDGFTAMVGDGANDALAIKKADLGIAMFEGAPATRELASVVLMNNSFTALPGGVELADSIIQNAEIFASLFFGTALTGLFLFCGVSLLGYSFPLTPLNITLINYFTVGLPGILVSYWTIRPVEKARVSNGGSFLRKIAPFIIWSSLLQSIILLTLFLMSPDSMKGTASNVWVVLASIGIGHIFFLFAPGVYRGALRMNQRRDLALLTIVDSLLLLVVFHVPLLLVFFEIGRGVPTGRALLLPIVFLGIYAVAQFGIARWSAKKE